MDLFFQWLPSAVSWSTAYKSILIKVGGLENVHMLKGTSAMEVLQETWLLANYTGFA